MKENLKAVWQKVLTYQVAKWNSADIGCNVGWLIIWALVGFMALWFKNSVLPWLYLALFVYCYVSYSYMACSRCPHYETGCYLLAAQMSRKFFKKMKVAKHAKFDKWIAINWITVTLFPVPFLLIYSSWQALGIYLMVAGGWHVQRHYTACLKCANTHCALNPEYK
jgi:hypothetical protein